MDTTRQNQPIGSKRYTRIGTAVGIAAIACAVFAAHGFAPTKASPIQLPPMPSFDVGMPDGSMPVLDASAYERMADAQVTPGESIAAYDR
jgi:hypothetical protein